jgi:hypothetical protein
MVGMCPALTRMLSVVEPRNQSLARATSDQGPNPWECPSAIGSIRRQQPATAAEGHGGGDIFPRRGSRHVGAARLGCREDLMAVAHITPREENTPGSTVDRWVAQTLAVPGDVVMVEAAQTPRGTCAGDPAVTVGHIVEATSIELCREVALRSRVLLRRRGARPWGSRSLAG